MYEDPNVDDFEFTVVFGFAGDAAYQDAIESRIMDFARDLGADCEIHRDNLLPDDEDRVPDRAIGH